MKLRPLFRTPLLAALALLLTMSACDFQAAEDAFDEFQVVIGLDPINTPVSGLIYEQATGEPVDVTLTFAGDGASSLIDAYSDPLASTLSVDGGALTFGVANSIAPTEASPFVFTVTASAEGFYTKKRTVTVTEVGSVEFEVTLVREVDATSTVQGTSAVQSTAVQSDQSGTVQQTTTIQTQTDPQSNSQATAAATVSAGTVPVTSSGQPLTGQIQTQIRAYDPSQGTQSLPQGVADNGDGTNQAVLGAVFFRMTDSNGNAVANFQSSGSGKNAAGKSGACLDAGGLFELSTTIRSILLFQYGDSFPQAEIWGYNPLTESKIQLGSTTLERQQHPNVVGTICVGGTLSNTDMSLLGDISEGVFFSMVAGNQPIQLPMNHSVTIVNPSVAGVPGQISFEGLGISGSRNVTFPGNTTTRSLASWLGVSGSFPYYFGTTYTLTVTPEGGSPTSVSLSEFSSGSSTINLTPPSVTRNYTVNASFQCPAGTKFDVSVSEGSLDGVSVSYRLLPNGAPRSIPNDDNIVKDTDQSTYIRVTGQLTAIAGQNYRFTGTLDQEKATVDALAPTGANTWNIALDSDDVGFECN